MSEISGEPSVEQVGPLPQSIQNYTFFAAGVVTDSKVRDAAKSLISYISSLAAQKSLTSKGFETR
jgi:molybdate transport system substrate-binding protein